MSWSFESVETHTGKRFGPVPITGFSGARSLNGGEGGSCSVILTDPDWSLTRAEWDQLVKPLNRTIVACWDDVPVFAGIIWDRTYEWGSGRLGLTLRDLWSVLEGRAVIGPNSTYPSHSYYKFGPANLATLADRVVRLAENNIEALENLPITYPAFIEGSEELRIYGYNALTVAEVLEDLVSRDGGPDIDFRPEWSGSGFQWAMGSNPSLNYVYQVDVNLPGGVSGESFTLSEDASNIVTRAYLFGEGTGRQMLSASATIGAGTQEYLTQERIYSGKRTKNRSILEGWGARTVNRYKAPELSAEMSIRVDGTPGLLDLKPGMKLNVQAPGDPWLDGQKYVMRLAGYSFSQGSSSVDLDVRLV